ncbi:hypothetical protein [Acinetobacter genomosp. 15BJ]|uniref:Chalcone isomerase domain-containing protein n=1 Tax=Acinetobacter genomosp. 15BJ TaxID=106651 RepID=R9B1S5_9GAMM|nr:hypothetical protein [Acinetobacter genomosp. 15BJ]EOR08367.1 hypothetical protein F896_01662 [Acinetobacter genomosp. 15BJ]MCH7290591.1 hypothetical protein [Acinetobacter genomosp. 15BJ]MDO3658534.1 hypothetical protein [Acinetobacter genomosp. 15BJ]
MYLRILSAFLILFSPLGINTSYAQVDFHLAYQVQMPKTKPVHFSNDRLFRFVSLSPFFNANELVNAKAILVEGRAVVEIEISASAQKKFNQLANRNTESQDQGLFNQMIGLGVMIDGQPATVIQGVYRPISDRKLWCFLIDDRLPAKEQLRQANNIVKKMKLAKASN